MVGVKGGSGKSTTAAYLAEALGAMGLMVALADADPQSTLVEWEAMAEEQGQPFSVRVHPVPSVPVVRRVLPGVLAAHEVVVVDCRRPARRHD
jgi:chromosome partitioning protein